MPQRDGDHRQHEERGGVDDESGHRADGSHEDPADRGAEEHRGGGRALHDGERAGDLLGPDDGGDERLPGGARDGLPEVEQQHEDDRGDQAVGGDRGDESEADEGLQRRDGRDQTTGREPVDEQSGPRCGEQLRQRRGHEQRGDREGAVALVARPEGEGDHGDLVAEHRGATARGDQCEVSAHTRCERHISKVVLQIRSVNPSPPRPGR